MKIKLLITLIISTLTSVVSASGNMWHESKIQKVYPTADGGFVLVFDTDSSNCPQTITGKYHYVTVGSNSMTQEGANKIYSLALMAATTDKTVHIYFDSGNNSCHINRMFAKF